MGLVYVLGLALLAAAASGTSSNRIINGNPVAIQNRPSVVQVESLTQFIFWKQTCGGSILTSIHIISAAICFSGVGYTRENRRIRAGASTLESGGVLVHVDREIIHPSYGLNGKDGDIAVVRLSSSLIFSPAINLAQIVASGTILPGGMLVTKVGWGVTSTESPDPAQELREAHVPVLDQNTCRQNYASLGNQPILTDNMFCAGSEFADSCTGDAGGPVFVGNIVVGIISWGHGCVIPGFPGVNTAVSSYTNWIIASATS